MLWILNSGNRLKSHVNNVQFAYSPGIHIFTFKTNILSKKCSVLAIIHLSIVGTDIVKKKTQPDNNNFEVVDSFLNLVSLVNNVV